MQSKHAMRQEREREEASHPLTLGLENAPHRRTEQLYPPANKHLPLSQQMPGSLCSPYLASHLSASTKPVHQAMNFCSPGVSVRLFICFWVRRREEDYASQTSSIRGLRPSPQPRGTLITRRVVFNQENDRACCRRTACLRWRPTDANRRHSAGAAPAHNGEIVGRAID